MIIRNEEGSAILSQTEIGGKSRSDFLLVGVSGSAAFAHFNPIDPVGTRPERYRPYLWAVCENGNSVTQEPVEFDIGGTDTNVPIQRCITPDQMLQIAIDYFNSGALPVSVPWEEDDA